MNLISISGIITSVFNALNDNMAKSVVTYFPIFCSILKNLCGRFNIIACENATVFKYDFYIEVAYQITSYSTSHSEAHWKVMLTFFGV